MYPEPIHSLLVKRLNHVEIKECNKKELYYNYDEKFIVGHHYMTQKLYVLDTNTPIELLEDAIEDVVAYIKEKLDEHTKVYPKISCNALYDFSSPQTMKCHGYFKVQTLIVLIDSGSTRNFMDPNVDKKVHSYIYP